MRQIGFLGAALAVLTLLPQGHAAVNVRTRGVNVQVGNGVPAAANVQVRTGLFGRVRAVSVQPSAYVNSQLLVDVHHRGQLNALNSFSYAGNTVQNIVYRPQRTVYLTQPPITAATIIEQRQYQVPVQPLYSAPRAIQQPCPCDQPTTQTPTDAQYLTQPVQRETVVERVQVPSCPAPLVERVQVPSCPAPLVERVQVPSCPAPLVLPVREKYFTAARSVAYVHHRHRHPVLRAALFPARVVGRVVTAPARIVGRAVFGPRRGVNVNVNAGGTNVNVDVGRRRRF